MADTATQRAHAPLSTQGPRLGHRPINASVEKNVRYRTVAVYENLDHSSIVPVQYQQMIGYQQEQWQSSASGSFGQFQA